MRRPRQAPPIREARPLGRPKLRSDEEQAAIITDMALDLFLSTGFISTRMDDIANRCRISKRTLYRLFPSKLDLFRAAVETHRRSMLGFPPGLDEMPLAAALTTIFRTDLDAEADGRRAAFVSMVLSEARHVPELAEIMNSEGAGKARAELAEWLDLRRKHEPLKIGDSFSAASILLDMIFGAPVLKPPGSAAWPGSADRAAYMRECIRYFVDGAR